MFSRSKGKVNWDTSESEVELLKPPEERIDGPTAFVSATSLPIKQVPSQSFDQSNYTTKLQRDGESNTDFEDSASAAEAARESANKAIAAAEAAKEKRGLPSPAMGGDHMQVQKSTKRRSSENYSNSKRMTESLDTRRVHRRHSYNIPPSDSQMKFVESDYDEEIEMEQPPSGVDASSDQVMGRGGGKTVYRRHSYNVSSTAHSGIKFDESDADEDSEVDEVPGGGNLPPSRPAPDAPKGPKLPPDYDSLAARFEALKYRKSR